MIRWSYVIPRLLLLGALMLALWAGLNPLVRWTAIWTGQAATTAKVDIARAETSLLGASVRLTDVRVANPQHPMKNLFEADQVTLALDSNSLLRRKVIVREGRVSGLRFGTDRDASGAIDWSIDWDVDVPHADLDDLGELGRKQLDQMANLLKQEVIKQAEQLESVRLAKDLYERWPVEYERMKARADSLRGRVESLKALSDTVRDNPLADNPLRTLGACQQAAIELQEMRQAIIELRGEIERLRRQTLSDKDAVVLAKERDLEKIRETFQGESLDAETLSEYLLGEELGETVRSLAAWVRWGRKYLPTGVEHPEPARQRGVDVLFRGIRRRPDFLIESLVLDGQVQRGGRRVDFLGTAAGITTQPELYGRPVVVKARINAQTEVALEAVLDHTGEKPHDRITVSCPHWKQPERVLGEPGRLAVAVSPGSTHLWVSLDLEGEQLSGRLLVQQGPVELVPDLAALRIEPRLALNLQAAMREVREIRVVVDLSGTLEKPEWGFQSNLGPQLASAVSGMFERELEARRQQLAGYVRGQVEEQLARFEGRILAEQQELLAKLDLNNTQIQQLNQTIAQRLRLPQGVLPEGLSKGLPKGLPFRF